MSSRGGAILPRIMRRRLTLALAITTVAAPPTIALATPPVVWVQAGHVAPGEPGYSAQTGASGGPFGDESAFTTRMRTALITRLKAAGVDARPLNSKIEPMGASGATFISLHHDQAGGSAAVGRAVTGGGENYYHGEGTGTASQTPYPDSGRHRTPATTVSPRVERTSTRLATAIATALGRIHTSANGASARFSGVVPRDSNPRMNHFYGYYRTNALARVLVELGAAGSDNVFLRKLPLISTTLSKTIMADLTTRGLR